MNRIALMVLNNIGRFPGMYAKICRYAKHPDRYPEAEMWAHIHRMMSYAVQGGNVELTVTGQEHLKDRKGCLLYGNHQGMFDVLAIAATCETPLGIVYKKELRNVPVLKEILTCTKSFAMDREDVRQSLTVIQNVTEEVRKGRNYVIFPEGTRSRKGNEMVEFHGGSFRCALKAKCPIIPMALIDSFRPLDEKGSKPLKVQLHYLTPIPYEEYKDLKSVELAALVKERIREAMEANMSK